VEANLRFGHHHLVVSAGVGDDGLVVDVGGVCGDRVEEMAVVGDGDKGAVRSCSGSPAASDGIEIEVVGRLGRAAGPGACRRELARAGRALLAALELTHAALVERLGNVETVEKDGSVGFGGVAVLVAMTPSSSPSRIPSASVSSGFS